MQDVGVDHVRTEVFERTRERLGDLGGDRGGRVVRQAVVLPAAGRELGLEEQLLAGDEPLPGGARDGPADGRLVVVPGLVGGVDAAEPLPQGEEGQRWDRDLRCERRWRDLIP